MDASDRINGIDRNKMRDFVDGSEHIVITNRFNVRNFNDVRIRGDKEFYRDNDGQWIMGRFRMNDWQFIEMLSDPYEVGDILRYTEDAPDRPKYYRDFE